METVRSKDGTKIAVQRAGEGPALVYVGGALNDRRSGDGLAALLAPDLTVLTYDRRGRGDSGDTPPYAVEREVEDLAAVVAAAGGRAAAFGMSSGAALALRAAAGGVPITSLVLFEPPFAADDEQVRDQARTYAGDLRAALAAGRPGDAVELFMKHVGMPAELIAGMRNAPMWPALRRLGPSLAYDSAVLGDAERGAAPPADVLAKVTVPVLVVDGGDSPAFMRDMARRVAAGLPDGRHRRLPGQTHDVAPDALAPAVREFLLG